MERTTQQSIYWPNFTLPPLNLWNIYPTNEMVDLHFKHNQKMFEEQQQISNEMLDNYKQKGNKK